MDVQTCGLSIESFAYDIQDLQFEWLENGINLRKSCKFDQLSELSSAFSKELSARLSYFERALSSAQLFLKVTQLSLAEKITELSCGKIELS